MQQRKVFQLSEDNQKPQLTVGGQVFQQKSRMSDNVINHDTTGSMLDILLAMARMCNGFLDETVAKHIAPFFSLISFGDLTVDDDKIEVVVPPTADIKKIRTGIDHIPRNSGGGNEGESSFEALMFMLEQIRFRPGSVRTCLLITDEHALMHKYKTEQVIAALREAQVMVFCITPKYPEFLQIAEQTGGKWEEIRPSGGSKDAHYNRVVKVMADQIASTVDKVYELGDGSVKLYLERTTGKR